MSHAKDTRPCALRQRAIGIAFAMERMGTRMRELVEDACKTDYISNSEADDAMMLRESLLQDALTWRKWAERAMNGGK